MNLLLDFFFKYCISQGPEENHEMCEYINICVTKLCLYFKIVPILLPYAIQAVLRILFVAMEI